MNRRNYQEVVCTSIPQVPISRERRVCPARGPLLLATLSEILLGLMSLPLNQPAHELGPRGIGGFWVRHLNGVIGGELCECRDKSVPQRKFILCIGIDIPAHHCAMAHLDDPQLGTELEPVFTCPRWGC